LLHGLCWCFGDYFLYPPLVFRKGFFGCTYFVVPSSWVDPIKFSLCVPNVVNSFCLLDVYKFMSLVWSIFLCSIFLKNQQNAVITSQYIGSQNTPHINCILLHVSAPRCHHQGVYQQQTLVVPEKLLELRTKFGLHCVLNARFRRQ